MPTAEKTAAIEQLQETIEKAASIYLADFTGLNVEQITDLRRKCRAEGVSFQVVKNTLAIKASRAVDREQLTEHFRGPTAMAVSVDDPTAPARILVDFHKVHEKPQVKLGFVDGRVLDADEVKKLASLPTRDQLISQVMQLAQAPAQGFVGVLNALMSQVVRTVDAVRDGKEKGTIAAPAAAEAEAAPAEAKAEAGDVKAEEAAGSDAPAQTETEGSTEAEEQKDGE
jgi:large subunit ribosomal protein L10